MKQSTYSAITGDSTHTPSTPKYMKKLASHVATWRLAMGLPNEGRAALDWRDVRQDWGTIQEELDELHDSDQEVDEMDAILDILFATLSYATRRYTPAQIGECWDAVCAANARKADGPIIKGKKRKPEGWVGPEAEIAAVLSQSSDPAPQP